MIDHEDLKKDREIKTKICSKDLVFKTTWGLFSPEEIDEGSKALLENVKFETNDWVLDLGCGYGVMGIAAAKEMLDGKVVMVDKDFVAVEYAKKNTILNKVNNAEVFLSNGFDQIPENYRFDKIIANLPAKVSRELFWIWFGDAKKYLKPGGEIYVVTIIGLKEFIKKNFKIYFGNYKKVFHSRKYYVAMAKKEA